MKFMSFFVLLNSLFFAACARAPKQDYPDLSIHVCDPQSNPSACPQNLQSSSEFSRELVLGDDGIGIEVDNPNQEKNLIVCLEVKLTLLEAYLSPGEVRDGLNVGEFIAETGFEVKSEGEKCVATNIFRSCTRKIETVRLICKYQIHKSAAL